MNGEPTYTQKAADATRNVYYKVQEPGSGKVILAVGGAAAIGLVGYGIYTYVTSAAPTKSQLPGEISSLVTQCNNLWGYFLKQNGGKPLDSAQLADISTCWAQVRALNAQLAAENNYIYTQLAEAGVVIAGLTIAGHYLTDYAKFLKLNGGPTSATEDSAIGRGAVTQSLVDNGVITPEEGSAAMTQSGQIAADNAATEAPDLQASAGAAQAAADAAGEVELAAEIGDTIDATSADVMVEYTYEFSDLIIGLIV